MKDTIAFIAALLVGVWVAAFIISQLDIDFTSNVILWWQPPAVISAIAAGCVIWMALYEAYKYVSWSLFVMRRNRE